MGTSGEKLLKARIFLPAARNCFAFQLKNKKKVRSRGGAENRESTG